MVTFNEEQKKAICHKEGAMLVLAGPGSGKTTVIIHRIKYLIEQYQVKPEEILVVTYTKAAAEEMKERFLQLSVIGGEKVMFGTFHSIFFRILRRAYGYHVEQILQEEERWTLLRKLVAEAAVETNDIEEYIRDFFTEFSLMKSELLLLKEYHTTQFPEEMFSYFVKKYERYKAQENKIDFEDMLVQCYEYLKTEEAGRIYWQKRFRYLLVDEYQDINQVQNECLALLAKPENNIFAVGDDDQSIYCFRGARPDFLLNFPKKYQGAKVLILPVNYRSTEKIIRFSQKIISHNKNRFEKQMHGAREDGRKIVFFTEKDAYEEGEKIAEKLAALRRKNIAYEEMAVIYRTNLQGGGFARALTQRGIPFVLKDKGMSLYSHWITRDLTAYLLLAQQPEDDSAFRKIANKPKRYLSRELLAAGETLSYPLLRGLYTLPQLKKYQAKALEELEGHLRQIQKRKPLEAIKYIRHVIGYDDYLREYATFRKASFEGYLEIAEEITQFASMVKDVTDFLQKLQEVEEELEQNSRQVRQRGKGKQGVTLSTMHSAKGLEFEVVFVPSLVMGIVPHDKSKTPEQIEEERRLFYVAVTRAKSRLYLSEIKERHDKGTKRSLFLRELGLR